LLIKKQYCLQYCFFANNIVNNEINNIKQYNTINTIHKTIITMQTIKKIGNYCFWEEFSFLGIAKKCDRVTIFFDHFSQYISHIDQLFLGRVFHFLFIVCIVVKYCCHFRVTM